MKTEDVTKVKEDNVIISMRISKQLRDWIDKNYYSKTKIFTVACNELGYKCYTNNIKQLEEDNGN